MMITARSRITPEALSNDRDRVTMKWKKAVNSFPYIIHVLDKNYMEAYSKNLTVTNSVYYQQMKLLLHWCLLFGKLPLRKVKSGEFKQSIFVWVYSILIFTALSGLNLYTSSELVRIIIGKTQVVNYEEAMDSLASDNQTISGKRSKEKSSTEYDATLFLLCFLGVLQWNVLTPWTDWARIGKGLAFLNKWKWFQEILALRLSKKLIGRFRKQINIAFFAITIVNMISVALLMESTLSAGSLLLKASLILSTTDGAIFVVLWWYTWRIIVQTGEEVTDMLVKEIKQGGSTRTFHDYRRVWLELTKIGEGFCDFVEDKMLLFLLDVLAIFIISAYRTAASFFDSSEADSPAPFVAMLAYTFAILLIVCESGHKVAETLGDKFVERIYECDLTKLSEEERFEVETLLKRTVEKPAKVVISDFLTVNRNLVVQIISGFLTYLIILVQFKISSMEPPTTLDNEPVKK